MNDFTEIFAKSKVLIDNAKNSMGLLSMLLRYIPVTFWGNI